MTFLTLLAEVCWYTGLLAGCAAVVMLLRRAEIAGAKGRTR